MQTAIIIYEKFFKKIGFSWNFLIVIVFFTLLLSCRVSTYYDITDYGAKGDSTTICTNYIQKTIDIASRTGGVVVIPKGKYLIGTLFLKSNVTLKLDNGAVLQGIKNLKEYTPTIKRDTLNKDLNTYHLLVMDSVENVNIIGLGTIDGLCNAFWEPHADPYRFIKPKEIRVSPMIEIYRSKNICIEQITIQNSAGWTLHLKQCENVKIDKIKIVNNMLGPNTDGIDINGCKDVFVSNCNIRTGDDAIVLKSSYNSDTCQNIMVTNCLLETNCVAMKLGTESFFNFRNVSFSNIVVKNCTRVFSLLCLDGATMENIQVTNITAETNAGWILNRVVEINANKRNENSKPGNIKNISIKNIRVKTDGRILIGAANGCKISNISIADVYLEYALLDDPHPIGTNAENDIFFFKNLPFVRGTRSAIVAENVENLRISEVDIVWCTYPLDTNWILLKHEVTWGNSNYDLWQKPNIITGVYKPVFQVFAGKNITKGKIDIRGTSSSDGTTNPTLLNNCNVLFVN